MATTATATKNYYNYSCIVLLVLTLASLKKYLSVTSAHSTLSWISMLKIIHLHNSLFSQNERERDGGDWQTIESAKEFVFENNLAADNDFWHTSYWHTSLATLSHFELVCEHKRWQFHFECINICSFIMSIYMYYLGYKEWLILSCLRDSISSCSVFSHYFINSGVNLTIGWKWNIKSTINENDNSRLLMKYKIL